MRKYCLNKIWIEHEIDFYSTGASRVLIFDHTIRRQSGDRSDKENQLRGPARRVHIDQSYKASEDRVKHHLPDEADELLKKRFQIINVRLHQLPSKSRASATNPNCYRSGVPSKQFTKTHSPSQTPIPSQIAISLSLSSSIPTVSARLSVSSQTQVINGISNTHRDPMSHCLLSVMIP